MKPVSSIIPLLFVLLALSFSGTANGSRAATTKAALTAARPLAAPDSLPADELSATGLLKEVEDDGYPYATLTIVSSQKQGPQKFTVNLEEVANGQMATLSALVGKTVSFRYTTESINALLDIEVGGHFLLDADAQTFTTLTNKVTGTLGADEITTSDVPGTLTITASDGEVTEFPFFITSELLEVNGTTVTAFYEERTINTIKAIAIAR